VQNLPHYAPADKTYPTMLRQTSTRRSVRGATSLPAASGRLRPTIGCGGPRVGRQPRSRPNGPPMSVPFGNTGAGPERSSRKRRER
jgi:hypothetical protein